MSDSFFVLYLSLVSREFSNFSKAQYIDSRFLKVVSVLLMQSFFFKHRFLGIVLLFKMGAFDKLFQRIRDKRLVLFLFCQECFTEFVVVKAF